MSSPPAFTRSRYGHFQLFQMKLKMFARQIAAFLCSVAALAGASEDAPIYAVVVPPAQVAAGSAFEFEVVTLNRSPGADALSPAAAKRAVLAVGAGRIPLTLCRKVVGSTASHPVPGGGFALVSYSATLPADAAAGLAAIEVGLGGDRVVRGAIMIAPAQGRGDDASSDPMRPVNRLVRAEPAVRNLRRVFADRVSPHESVYFIGGADDPAVKFQLRFKYKVLDFQGLRAQHMARSLHVAYRARCRGRRHADNLKECPAETSSPKLGEGYGTAQLQGPKVTEPAWACREGISF